MIETASSGYPAVATSGRPRWFGFSDQLRAAARDLPWWQSVMALNAVAIMYVFSAGLVGADLITRVRGWGDGVPPNLAGAPSALQALFARYDSGYYLEIAQRGYSADGVEHAFFPLYPLLVHWLSTLTTLGPLWAGLLISVGAFVLSTLLLYRWVLCDYDRDVARSSVVALCVFPLSFFFVAFYAESIFLLCSIASVYFARRNRFALSGLAIAFAGAARPQAFLLAIPLALEFWRAWRSGHRQFGGMLIGVLVAPLGSLGFLAWVWLQAANGATGGSSQYLSGVEAGWKTFITWPWVTLADGIQGAVFGSGVSPDWFSRTLVWHDLLFGVAGIAISIWAIRYLRLSTAAFLVIGVIILYTTHGPYGYALWSITRRLATVFPIYLALALLLQRAPARLRWTVLAASCVWLGALSAWFASGRWVA